MGKSRKKKNADFKKVKLKVGRRLPKGKDVDLSFATKKICIREDKPLLDESSGHRVLYLSLVSNTPAYFPSLAQGMFSALVHIDVGVRAAGWEYLRLMIEVAPRILPSLNCSRLLDELSRRVPQESVGLSSKRTGNVVKLIERLLTVLSAGGRADEVTGGCLQVDGLLTPSRGCFFDWDSAGMDRMWLNGHVSRAMECGLGWAGQETYSVTGFLSDLSPWFSAQVAEFQDVSECREEAAARLVSLLAILRMALRRHVFVEPLSAPSLARFAGSAEILWRLFPLPEDAAVFRSVNMAVLHVKCLAMVAGGDEADEGEARKLGEFFNASMAAVWPPPRSLCLQWTAAAELCLRPEIVRGRGKWTGVLISIVRKIADCNAQQGSKVGALCRRIVSLHQDMMASMAE